MYRTVKCNLCEDSYRGKTSMARVIWMNEHLSKFHPVQLQIRRELRKKAVEANSVHQAYRKGLFSIK